MTNPQTVYCYFWIKVVETKGQIADDRAALTGMSPVPVAAPATTDSPTTVWAAPNLSLATTDSPTTVWSLDAAKTTPAITISAVESTVANQDAAKSQMTMSCITLNQKYDTEAKARAWIESDNGKAWRGNAQLCVLHRIAIKLPSA